MKLLRQRISDGGVLALIEAFLTQGVMESGRDWQPTTKGTPQGAVFTPRTQWITIAVWFTGVANPTH
jgi:RNA-directed DNA polymerase